MYVQNKDISDEQIIEAVNTCPTMRQAQIFVNMSASSFKRRCIAIGVYHPNQGGRNAQYPVRGKHSRISLTEITAGKHPYYQTDKLRRRLIAEGVKKHECEICGTKDWLGQKVAVVLDHIDGNNSNHLLSNLRIICRNCDGNLETFAGRNKG
ncbi:HNH endonuclease [Psychromonas aquimarina]|uniref:HNH endonuclease n=1 Tax=Psychromonas aquimarina TaxID=444919 RepID=UPI000686B434|nr:HNH endonuclease [Psychromonas aquimarina]